MWVHEAWATGHEEWQAVKITVSRPQRPTGDQRADLRAKVVGQYRLAYGEWHTGGGEKITQR